MIVENQILLQAEAVNRREQTLFSKGVEGGAAGWEGVVNRNDTCSCCRRIPKRE